LLRAAIGPRGFMTERIIVDVAIAPEALAEYYRGRVRDVVVRAHDGRIVRFPLTALRGAVTRLGVSGRFELTVEGRRLVSIVRVGSIADVGSRANR